VTFDNKANIAVFVGDVVVKDPDFNCMCDKLTAHLKKKAAPAANPNGNGTPAPNKSGGGGGGLEKAIAESTSDRRVILTQEKVEVDGSITHSLGKANRAVYDAASGDIYLHGSPEVTQGPQRMTALTPETIIIINRDGKLRSEGPTKSVIIDQSKQDR
jgi:lipopolysaccharide export system protein LptA